MYVDDLREVSKGASRKSPESSLQGYMVVTSTIPAAQVYRVLVSENVRREHCTDSNHHSSFSTDEDQACYRKRVGSLSNVSFT